MKETWILYQTTNLVNGKIYVGVHKLADTSYSKRYLGSGDNMKKAIKKYGRKSFTRVTLAEFTSSENAYAAESEMVTEEFSKRLDTYNVSLGGRGGASLTTEMKAKIGVAAKGNQYNLGKKLTDEHKARISAAGKGRKHSEATKAKMSLASKGNKRAVGRVVSAEVRQKLSTAYKGRTHTVESKAKMSVAKKGVCISEEHKANISASKTGSKNPKSIPVILKNIYYESANLAAKEYQVSTTTIFNRVKSKKPEWSEWLYYVEDEGLGYPLKNRV